MTCLLLSWGMGVRLTPSPTPPPWADERLIPTETPRYAHLVQLGDAPIPSVTPTPSPTATGTPTVAPTQIQPSATLAPSITFSTMPASATLTPASTAVAPYLHPTTELPLQIPADDRWRFGALDRHSNLLSFDYGALELGWILTGLNEYDLLEGVEQVFMVHVQGDQFTPAAAELGAFVAAHPGSVWEIGNEPDVIWQAKSTPEEYARVYHELYLLIKDADPTAVLAAGAISQPTPMRLQYLDLVLEAYRSLYQQKMPVDIWAIHNAILREERGSWGVEIPPGIEQDTGQLYGVTDNARLDLFVNHLVGFRTWMRDRGYRDRPLILTEFGVLMPPEYGFPPEKVLAFMTGTFDFMLTATDPEIGYPPDGNRLVQRWVWYALAAEDYSTGNLFDPRTKEITPLGQAFADYALDHQ